MKKSISIGIDISKLTFDIAVYDGSTFIAVNKYAQNKAGYRDFLQLIKDYENPIITCEATGRLFKALAKELIAAGHKISVVNPLIIANYAKMLLSRNKTDAADAKIIAQYGYSQEPYYWTADSEAIEELKAYSLTLDMLKKQSVQINNTIKALENDFEVSPELMDIKQNIINKIKTIRKKMNAIIKAHYNEEKKILQSIPGIAEEAIFIIIAHYGCFEKFKNARQVISYTGTDPQKHQSGTSINSPARISRKGNKEVRKKLYMCSLSASIHNEQCKIFYNRLKENGKKGKVARIAVLNKLLRQCFYCLKNKELYDPKK